MFIELAEMLRCPEPHEESFCVVLPDEMAGRTILRGVIGCPVCRKEFPIRGGVAELGPAPSTGPESELTGDLPEPQAIAALLGLGGPGGYVLLIGAATGLAAGLAAWLAGIHFVGINPSGGRSVSPVLSVLVCDRMVPLRSSMARGVVVGPDLVSDFWIGEAARVVLRGLRVVVLGRESCEIDNLTQLAAGKGMWVGEKRAEGGR